MRTATLRISQSTTSIMTGRFKNYLRATTNIDERGINEIVNSFKLRKVNRGTVLVDAGEVCKEFYFVGCGSVRTYFLNSAGQQRSRVIALEGAVVTALSSFVGQAPSTEFVEAIEDSELYVITYSNFRRLLVEIPGWLEFYNHFLEIAYMHQHKKLQQLATLTAAQRYQELLADHPEYVQRLSNKILASYLDIREETLSRLKST
ncbi:cyclic nucleotide-binding domain-containing protein [Pedobacter sp. HMF7647]|uniref:Cyclic nucleotide-binding domain-containing protein n=1 Tax=Hufsiella arboris TaxID=2695275 RepID=A0A7K1YA79_9SPHI|nr:Crp/Fnr family transcriptional regulator [Hufsiella arboris]MXV51330.1 cyclic nucleotide-binding domain-containing protein [Hufsiella arboris]